MNPKFKKYFYVVFFINILSLLGIFTYHFLEQTSEPTKKKNVLDVNTCFTIQKSRVQIVYKILKNNQTTLTICHFFDLINEENTQTIYLYNKCTWGYFFSEIIDAKYALFFGKIIDCDFPKIKSNNIKVFKLF